MTDKLPIEYLASAYDASYKIVCGSKLPPQKRFVDEGRRFIEQNLPFVCRFARFRGKGFESVQEIAAIGMTFGS